MENLRSDKPIWSAAHGERLRRLRNERLLSQDGLRRAAKPFGLTVSVKSLNNWENGKHQPRGENLNALASFFGIELNYLLAPIVVEIPPLGPTGITLFRVLPTQARNSLIVEPIVKSLRRENFEYVLVEDFDMAQLWAEIEAILNRPLGEEDSARKAALMGWAREKGSRALVLSGFCCEFEGTDLETCEKEWARYLAIIRSVKSYCHVIMIQAVNPFHFWISFRAGSGLDLKAHQVDLPIEGDPALLVDNVLRELPPCCLQSLQRILGAKPADEFHACLVKLVEARVLRKVGTGHDLGLDETCRWALKEKLLERP